MGSDIYDTGNRLKYTAQKVNILPMRQIEFDVWDRDNKNKN